MTRIDRPIKPRNATNTKHSISQILWSIRSSDRPGDLTENSSEVEEPCLHHRACHRFCPGSRVLKQRKCAQSQSTNEEQTSKIHFKFELVPKLPELWVIVDKEILALRPTTSRCVARFEAAPPCRHHHASAAACYHHRCVPDSLTTLALTSELIQPPNIGLYWFPYSIHDEITGPGNCQGQKSLFRLSWRSHQTREIL